MPLVGIRVAFAKEDMAQVRAAAVAYRLEAAEVLAHADEGLAILVIVLVERLAVRQHAAGQPQTE